MSNPSLLCSFSSFMEKSVQHLQLAALLQRERNPRGEAFAEGARPTQGGFALLPCPLGLILLYMQGDDGWFICSFVCVQSQRYQLSSG